MSAGVVPSHVDRPFRVFLKQSLKQLRNLSATLVALELHNGFPRMIVNRANAVILVGLPRSGNHHLLAFRTPHRMQGGKPTEIKLILIIEHLTGLQVITGLFNRLFFSRYSGSGLLIVCCGRERTISASASTRRTVS